MGDITSLEKRLRALFEGISHPKAYPRPIVELGVNPSNHPHWQIYMHCVGAVYQRHSFEKIVQKLWEQILNRAPEEPEPYTYALILCARLELYLPEEHNLALIDQVAKRAKLFFERTEDSSVPLWQGVYSAYRGAAALRRGDTTRTVALCVPAIGVARQISEGQDWGTMIHPQVLVAVAYANDGLVPDAAEFLEAAISTCHPQQYASLFYGCGALLRAAGKDLSSALWHLQAGLSLTLRISNYHLAPAILYEQGRIYHAEQHTAGVSQAHALCLRIRFETGLPVPRDFAQLQPAPQRHGELA